MPARTYTLPVLLLPSLAHAHHATDFAVPTTFGAGLLSGLAHPVIGIDHLLFVLAVGIAAHVMRAPILAAAAFLLATCAGTLAHFGGFQSSGIEAAVALTMIGLGALLLTGAATTAVGALVLALCGLVHGYAYAEAVAGAEAAPLLAYLIGYTVVQAVLVGLVYLAVRSIDRRGGAPTLRQPAGFVLSLAGAVFLGISTV